MVRYVAISAFISALAVRTLAQQAAWAQCGGEGWTGGTTCVSGYVCTASNQWYSQCVPGTAAPTTSTRAATTTTAGPSPTSTGTPRGPNYWFSFGDSYTATGFNINGVQPTVGNPLGNPKYPGNTFSGGENWIGAATTKYNHSVVLTYNFAVGGAVIDQSVVSSSIPSVKDQVASFLSWNSRQSTRPWTSQNALFSIWIGINDLGATFYQGGDRAADVGARNFLFLNVPPMDRSPQISGGGGSATEKPVIVNFNSKLATAMANFKANHAGTTTYLYDAYSAFAKVLDSPTTYGFKDATSSGQSGSFWYDPYHPIAKASVLFGQQVGQLLAGTVW